MIQRPTRATPATALSTSGRTRHRRLADARATRRDAVEALEGRCLLAAELISVGSGGNAGNDLSVSPSVSPDGRFVVFASRATDLVPGFQDTNGLLDVFLRDRTTGATHLVSRSVDGERAGDRSSGGDGSVPSVSADGRYVAFQSKARDLLEDSRDAFDTQDVFVRDMQTGVTTMLSVTGNGNEAGGERPVISANGRYVAFHSSSLLLVPNVPRTNNSSQVFVKDLQTGTLTIASINPAGNAAANGNSAFASISGDGRYVAFVSEATNLAAEDDAGGADVFVRDLQTNTTTLVSVDVEGDDGGNAASLAPVISSDGRFVAFESAASNLVAGHPGDRSDVFVRNLAAKTTTLVSVNQPGIAPGSGESRRASISPDGRFVAFSSTAPNMAAEASDVDQYVRDTVQNVTYGVRVNPGGSVDDPGGTPAVTAAGRVAAALTGTALPADKNAEADVYLVDVVPGTVDTAGPAPTIPATQPSRTTGSKTIDFDVAYADATGVKVDTLGDGDLVVTLPDGSTQPAKFVKMTGTGTSVTGTYRVNAPGDSLGPEDNGSYAVAILPGAVSDTAGNAALPASVGAFTVTLGGGTPDAGVELVPTVTLAAPPAVIAGASTGKVTVKVTNNGDGNLSDTVRVTLYASTDGTLDAGDANLLTFDRRLKIKGAGGFKNVKTVVVFPSSLPQNTYFLLAAVDEPNIVPEENDFNNVAVTSNSVVVAEPFVDLAGSFPKQPPLNVARGKPLPLSLVLQNAGNIATRGNLTVNIALSANGALDAGDPVLATLARKVSFKAGAVKTLKLKLKVPTGVAHGTYRIYATLDTLGTINESNTTNNTAATNAFQIS